MNKTLKHEGPLGTFFGTVSIVKTRKPVTVHNRSTHDEEMKVVDYYMVTGSIDGREVCKLEGVGQLVLAHCSEVEEVVLNKLKIAANPPEKTIVDALRERGYE